MQKYRSDIDGLRAVAVLSVFAFHLSPLHFPAGGIGVDIFFVISGYLIGGIILRETAAGDFSIARFYERRIRRIAPALLMALAATLLIGWVLLLPNDLAVLGASSSAAVLSVSNFYFWQTIDYFDQGANNVATLHTWSLGVEEQFYLVVPFLIPLLRRWLGRWLGVGLIVLALASLGISEYLVRTAPITAFYLPHSRAWELLVGLLLNLYPLTFLRDRRWREIAAWAGALGFAIAFFTLRPERGFPGLAAVLPCLSVALVIGAGEQGPHSLGKLLALKPVLFVGLISYSLYLWHWPAIIFVKEYYLTQFITWKMAVIILTLAFVPAILSWRFVERPFRSRHIPAARVYAISGGAAAVMLALELVCAFDPMLVSPVPPRIAALQEFGRASLVRVDRGGCFLSTNQSFADYDRAACLAPKAGARNVLLIGDSHAAMYRTAIKTILGAHVLEATAAGCTVESAALGRGGSTCAGVLSTGVAAAPTIRPLAAIVLSSRWENVDAASLATLLDRLRASAPVILIGPVPEYETGVPKLLAKALVARDPTLPDHHRRPGLIEDDAAVRAIAAAHGARYVSMADVMCHAGHCLIERDQWPLYFDNNHLTRDAAALFFAQALKRSGAAIG